MRAEGTDIWHEAALAAKLKSFLPLIPSKIHRMHLSTHSVPRAIQSIIKCFSQSSGIAVLPVA